MLRGLIYQFLILCFLLEIIFSDDPPESWTCDAELYYAGDGICHCECGAYDPDCIYLYQASDIVGCNPPTDQVAIGCSPVDGSCVYKDWTCPEEEFWSHDGCHCKCGYPDRDCFDRYAAIDGCNTDEGCNLWTGECMFMRVMGYYNAWDGCDCAEGDSPDPDCYIGFSSFYNYPPGTSTSYEYMGTYHYYDRVCKVQQDYTAVHSYGEYNCYYADYGRRDGCNCDCNFIDPDCWDETQPVYCSYGQQDGLPLDEYFQFECIESSPGGYTFCNRIGWDWEACNPYYFNDGGCDCECGIWDVDCDDDPSVGDDYFCGKLDDGASSKLVRNGWTCDYLAFEDGFCNCSCGAWDPDCDVDNQVDEDYYCMEYPEGVAKLIPYDWFCDPTEYEDGSYCDCGCGTFDPDCANPDLPTLGCETGEVCAGTGICVAYCDESLYNASDALCQCHCNGVWDHDDLDPDCLMEGVVYMDCPEGYVCSVDDFEGPRCVPEAWTCDSSRFNDSICDCGCGAYDDPDCVGWEEVAVGCTEEEPYCSYVDLQCHKFSEENIGAGDGCHCGTRVWDPDCWDDLDGYQKTYGCEDNEGCYYQGDDVPGECIADPNWFCWPASLGTGDGCDCNCGKWDPDCDEEGAVGKQCATYETCFNNGGFSRCVPNNWTCNVYTYQANDGCHCNCGAHDADCNDPDQPVIGCLPGEYCNSNGKCEIIYPAPDEWFCDRDIYYAGDSCDCECGAYDPDCNNMTLHDEHLEGCEPEQYCGSKGTCMDHNEDPMPHGWYCPDDWYDSADGCHCECGGWDPDCDDPDQEKIGCLDDQTCLRLVEDEMDVGKCVWNLPTTWTCPAGDFYSGGGCNCSCGAYDKDCDDPNAELFGCLFEYEFCNLDGYCECEDHYTGYGCSQTTCDGIPSIFDEWVCSGHGVCYPYETCNCTTDHYLGEYCEITYCHGILSNDPDVCEGHGDCFPYEYCTCDPLYDYSSEGFCNITTCGGLYTTNETVCNQHGECMIYEDCECTPGTPYYGSLCEITICDGYFTNDTDNVCSGHGHCYPENKCNCDVGYNGTNCEIWECFGMDRLLTLPEEICGGRGPCVGKDECDCEENYYDSDVWYEGVLGYEEGEYEVEPCSIYKCHGHWNLHSDVCSGNGTCSSPDNCTCNSGFYQHNCTDFLCYGVNLTADPHLVECSGNGDCVYGDTCSCEFGYVGDECEFHTCFMETYGVQKEIECSGNGLCVDLDRCSCTEEWEGEECETEIVPDYWMLVGVPVTITTSTVIVLIFINVCLVIWCFCFVLCFSGCILIMYREEIKDYAIGDDDLFDSDDSDFSDFSGESSGEYSGESGEYSTTDEEGKGIGTTNDGTKV